MVAGNWTLTATGLTKLTNGVFLDADTYKCALFASTSDLSTSSDVFADVSDELPTANGYTAGGASITISRTGTDVVVIDATDVTFTASGGSLVARWAAIYEVSGSILAFCLLDATPADVTALDGNTIDVVVAADGLFELTVV